jgi:hypothetical protein
MERSIPQSISSTSTAWMCGEGQRKSHLSLVLLARLNRELGETVLQAGQRGVEKKPHGRKTQPRDL